MISLYITSYNTPEQFNCLIESMLEYDSNFINKTNKYLINNSDDDIYLEEYDRICKEYNVTQIKNGNIGIMGARILAANHFESTDDKFYFYFEDDMLLQKEGKCRNGLNRYVDNLFNKSIRIISENKYDFLKINFTEVILSNDYDYPESLKKTRSLFSGKKKLVKTKFNNLHFHEGLAYLDGHIYISNWPLLMSKEGNRKCYIERVCDRLFEHQLSSLIHKDIINGNISPAILLLSPIHHQRFFFYKKRKEF
jgi:hypothetical protein